VRGGNNSCVGVLDGAVLLSLEVEVFFGGALLFKRSELRGLGGELVLVHCGVDQSLVLYIHVRGWHFGLAYF